MRRLIAYISMAVSMLIAVGVAATPVLTKLNNGREFTNGREIVFKLDTTDENFTEETADEIAKEMRTRLDNFNIEDYSVAVQGDGSVNDTITASFAVERDEFNYVAKYLEFSGNHFAISGKLETTIKDETPEHDIFKVEEARIEYEQDTIPVIVIPVTDEGKADIENIVSIIEEGNDNDQAGPSAAIRPVEVSAHDGDEEEAPQETPNMFLWANYEEGDSYELASHDPLVREKILMSFYSDHIWYEKSKTEKTEISFICATATEDNQLDLSGLKNDNIRANYLLNMLKSSKYSVSVTCPTRNVTEQGVDYYTNSTLVEPSYENLISLGKNVNIAVSATLIATLVAIVVVSAILVAQYKLLSIGMIATTIATLFIALLSFSNMSVLFNFPAIIGLLILAAGTLFGEIYYVSRFKEEVLKGRSLKKANQEASKKSNLITLDASIVLAFAGLMMYAIGGISLRPLGVVLFFGAVFALLMNLLVFKLMMKFVTNETSLANKYASFGIKAEEVKDFMGETQKEVVAEKAPTLPKKSKLAGIIACALMVASVAGIVTFGIIDGSPLNVKNATKNTTVIYTELRADNPMIQDEENYKEFIIDQTSIEGNIKLSVADVAKKDVTNFEYHPEGSETNETLYFVVKANNTLNAEELDNVKSALNARMSELGLDAYVVSNEVRTSKELVYTPDQGLVALATGITVLGAALYCAFRFRPANALALLGVTTITTTVSYGVLVLTRLGTTAVTSLAMPVVAVTTILASLFYLANEKALKAEYRGEFTKEQRREIAAKTLAKVAMPTTLLLVISAYIALDFLALGIGQTIALFTSVVIGIALSAVAVFLLLPIWSIALSEAFKNVKLPKIKMFERKEKQTAKRNSSEPEESIFIGIND